MSVLCSDSFFRAPVLLLAWLFLSPANASTQDKGIVNMQGAIVDTACTINTGDLQQSIYLGALPLSTLAHQGKGAGHRFTIQLTHCVPARSNARQNKLQGIQTTFEGAASGSLFTLEGSASGVALEIGDAAGNIAISGQALPGQAISPGDMQLNYILTPVRNQQPLMAGRYFATIRFRLDYF